jgi:hypothetical protein
MSGGPTTGSATDRRGRKAQSARAGGEDAWQTWWLLNRLSFLPDREEARRRRVVTTDPLARLGEAGSGATSDAGQDRAFAARTHVVPFLRSVLEPARRSRDDVKASALIALAKLCAEPETVALLLAHLEDPREAPLVRESAALAVGLLRRTDAAAGLPAAELDPLRDRLLAAFDDERAPTRTRAFAALALGLLGDQPFGEGFAAEGRLVVRELWSRLGRSYAAADLPVALLTAIGMQPLAGVPDGVREGLKSLLAGRHFLGRRWSATERSHALTALARLGGPDATGGILRVLARRNEDVAVKRAALVALGARAEDLDADERAEAAATLLRALEDGRDPLTTGLAQIALGRVLGADLASEKPTLLDATVADDVLLREAHAGAVPTRGFSILALALAARGVPASSRSAAQFLNLVREELTKGVARASDDASLRAACAVGLGLLECESAVAALAAVMTDDGQDPELRGHAAVALGQIGRRSPELLRSLVITLAERTSDELRSEVALGLSFLGSREASLLLLREIRSGETERLLAQVAVALGRLGDVGAVKAVIESAADERRSELARALSIAALGLLCDPESRPSLLRLSADANYPARTEALHEALTIL